MSSSKFGNVFGKCNVPDCNKNCSTCDTSPEGGTKICGFCGHHQNQHTLLGMMNLQTGEVTAVKGMSTPATSVQSTASSYNSSRLIRPFAAPSFSVPTEESRHVFQASAALAVKSQSKKGKVKERSVSSASVDASDLSLPAVFFLPLDSACIPTSNTAEQILEREGKKWNHYTFSTVESLLREVKLRGGVTLADQFHDHQFFIYLVERLRKWIPTGCSHARMPTVSDIRAWKADMALGKRLVVVPECDAKDVGLFEGKYMDMTNESEDEFIPTTPTPTTPFTTTTTYTANPRADTSMQLSDETISAFLLSAGFRKHSAQWNSMYNEVRTARQTSSMAVTTTESTTTAPKGRVGLIRRTVQSDDSPSSPFPPPTPTQQHATFEEDSKDITQEESDEVRRALVATSSHSAAQIAAADAGNTSTDADSLPAPARAPATSSTIPTYTTTADTTADTAELSGIKRKQPSRLSKK